MNQKKSHLKFFLWIIFGVFLICALYGAFFVWKVNELEKRVALEKEKKTTLFETFKNLASPQEIRLRGYESGRINILFLGIAGEGKPGKNLTDTIMVASLNTKTNQVGLISLPRDLFVKIPSINVSLKINTIYQFGLDKAKREETDDSFGPILEATKEVTGLDMDYWCVVNFEAFEKIVEAIGGINVNVERDIYDPRYPGPNYSYETFALEKGLHHLDGATALKYARMRHNDPEGDFGRAKRQQRVLQSIRNKVFSTSTLLDVVALSKIMEALGNNIKTNIAEGDLESFLALARRLDTDNIANVVLDAWNEDSLLKVSHIFSESGFRSFILVSRIGNWSETKKLSKNIFDFNEMKKERENVEKEGARVGIINLSGNSQVLNSLENLLKKSFRYKEVTVLRLSNKNLIPKSAVYDLSGGLMPYTTNELIEKLPAEMSSSLEEKYADIFSRVPVDLVVLAGQDLINNYSVAPISFSEYNEAEESGI